MTFEVCSAVKRWVGDIAAYVTFFFFLPNVMYEEWLDCAQQKCGHLVQLLNYFHADTIHT